MREFVLHPRLAEDTLTAAELQLSRLLLMNDARYPWFILAPRVADIREIHQLPKEDRLVLWEESLELSRAMERLWRPDKLNVAAIGNLVPQLHLHHVARYTHDETWPRPVWGIGEARPYDKDPAEAAIRDIRAELPSALLMP